MTEHKEIIVALIAVFGAVIPYLLQKNKGLTHPYQPTPDRRQSGN
jgi:hypothetical protein